MGHHINESNLLHFDWRKWQHDQHKCTYWLCMTIKCQMAASIVLTKYFLKHCISFLSIIILFSFALRTVYHLLKPISLHKCEIHMAKPSHAFHMKTHNATNNAFRMWSITTQNMWHVPTVPPLSHSTIAKTGAVPFFIAWIRKQGLAVVFVFDLTVRFIPNIGLSMVVVMMMMRSSYRIIFAIFSLNASYPKWAVVYVRLLLFCFCARTIY